MKIVVARKKNGPQEDPTIFTISIKARGSVAGLILTHICIYTHTAVADPTTPEEHIVDLLARFTRASMWIGSAGGPLSNPSSLDKCSCG